MPYQRILSRGSENARSSLDDFSIIPSDSIAPTRNHIVKGVYTADMIRHRLADFERPNAEGAVLARATKNTMSWMTRHNHEMLLPLK